MTDAQREQLEFLSRTVEVPGDEGLRALREAGEIWQLRDELQRAVGLAYNARNLENCGRVWLEMGDARRAGTYLFWSGARREAYARAIALFWAQHAHKQHKELRAISLQSGVCLPDSPGELPPRVLQELGADDLTWDDLMLSRNAEPSLGEKLTNVTYLLGCALAVIGFAVCLGLGAYTLWQITVSY